MKKISAGIISAILILYFAVTAYAAQAITEPNGNKQIDVQAKAVYISPENVYTGAVSNGNATITIPGGATMNISANGTLLDGLTLNIIEIANGEEDAYSWISGIMEGLCDEFKVYNVYFTDENRNPATITEDVTVSITTPDGYTDVRVYHIGSDGTENRIESKQSGENTVFTATEFNYYVLADNADDDGTTDPTKPGNPDSPPTGDTSNMALWLALMLVSCGVLTTIAITKKRKETNSK